MVNYGTGEINSSHAAQSGSGIWGQDKCKSKLNWIGMYFIALILVVKNIKDYSQICVVLINVSIYF